MPQQQIARMKGFYLKVRAVTRDEKPVGKSYPTEELDRAGWKGNSRRSFGSAGSVLSERTSQMPLSLGDFS
jgi:hypothetical protein